MLTKGNYTELVELDELFGDKGLRILGFPCNQFWKQEPGTNAEIKEFAEAFGVKFPLFAKTDVNGPDTCEVYKYLRLNSELFDPKTNLVREISWSWAKFLVDENGQVIKFYDPRVSPKQIVADFERMLET